MTYELWDSARTVVMLGVGFVAGTPEARAAARVALGGTLRTLLELAKFGSGVREVEKALENESAKRTAQRLGAEEDVIAKRVQSMKTLTESVKIVSELQAAERASGAPVADLDAARKRLLNTLEKLATFGGELQVDAAELEHLADMEQMRDALPAPASLPVRGV